MMGQGQEVGKVFNAGVDALTVWYRPGQQSDASVYACAMLLRALRHSGGIPKQASIMGYKGSVVRGLFRGEKSGGVLYSAMGSVADSLAVALRGDLGKVTRVDLQVTFRLVAVTPGFVDAYFGEIAPRCERLNEVCSLVRGKDGLNTAYVGRRGNEHFYRVYDKSGEYGMEAGTLVRFEVEIKGNAARRVAATLDETSDRLKCVLDLLYSKFVKKGLPVPPIGEYRQSVMVMSEHRSDVEKALDWLRTSVAPVLDKLDRLGYNDDVVQALRRENPARREGKVGV